MSEPSSSFDQPFNPYSEDPDPLGAPNHPYKQCLRRVLRVVAFGFLPKSAEVGHEIATDVLRDAYLLVALAVAALCTAGLSLPYFAPAVLAVAFAVPLFEALTIIIVRICVSLS